MNKFGLATLVGTALSAAAVGLAAPSVAAPSSAADGRDNVTTVESLGYTVVNNHSTVDVLKRD